MRRAILAEEARAIKFLAARAADVPVEGEGPTYDQTVAELRRKDAMARRMGADVPHRPWDVDDVPHCRSHIQFRSDCAECASAREFS